MKPKIKQMVKSKTPMIYTKTIGLVHSCKIKGGQIVLEEIRVERSIGIEKSTIYKQYNVYPSKTIFILFFQKKVKGFFFNVYGSHYLP